MRTPILKVGYQYFALSPATRVGPIVDALAKAVYVDCEFDREGMVFFPGEKRHGEIELQYVDDSRIRKTAPSKEKPATPIPTARIGAQQRAFLTSGS